MTQTPQRRARHVPIRRCLGCGDRHPRAELVRFVAVPSEGFHTLVHDPAGRAEGRGLYTCPRRQCFDRAVERQAFRRAAKVSGSVECAGAAESLTRMDEVVA